jgi:hypothetical protein
MSVTRKQKRESRALKAEAERLMPEITNSNGAVNTPPGTNAINITEEGISPTVSLARGVDPDTDQSETGPPTDTNVTERATSPTVSLSQKVDPDTVQTETGPPADTNITERAISSTASFEKTP